MGIVNAREMLITATKQKYAVGAFNITNLLQMQAVVNAHKDAHAPLIIQTSVSPARLIGPDVIVAVYRTIAAKVDIPICLHLDHCEHVAFCKQCADAGYTNIVIDASKEEFEDNVRMTREVVDYCHALGDITVEGELGTVSGVEDQIRVSEDESQLCNPEQALQFVAETGIDLLAPAIGTAHGVYKTPNPKVDFDRLGRIAQLLNGEQVRTPLVVHGGTGLPAEYISRLITMGGSKFNVSTDLKRSWIDAHFEYISAHREEYNPGKLDQFAMKAIKAKVSEWIELLGSTGKA